MKLFILFFFFILPGREFAQANELNELFKKYASEFGSDDFKFDGHPPVALQNSRELVMPFIVNLDTLWIIKWKDVDSARIFDTRERKVAITIYGKVIKYQKCKKKNNCTATYFGSLYHPKNRADSMLIPLSLKTGIKPSFSDDIRNRFRQLLHQINNIPVTERYLPVEYPPAIFYNDSMSAIIYNYDSSGPNRSSRFSEKRIRNAKKVVLVGFGNKRSVKETFIVSGFTIFIVRSGMVSQIFNEGEIFNDEVLKVINIVGPGDTIIFDQVFVTGPDGSKRTIQLPGLMVE